MEWHNIGVYSKFALTISLLFIILNNICYYVTIFFFFKILDVYGALACLEHLETQELNWDFQKHWLKQVMKLQVPIEVVCSELSIKQYGERSREMVKLIQ